MEDLLCLSGVNISYSLLLLQSLEFSMVMCKREKEKADRKECCRDGPWKTKAPG